MPDRDKSICFERDLFKGTQHRMVRYKLPQYTLGLQILNIVLTLKEYLCVIKSKP
jgi:hypothetical protein